jgi:hypothetical protein
MTSWTYVRTGVPVRSILLTAAGNVVVAVWAATRSDGLDILSSAVNVGAPPQQPVEPGRRRTGDFGGPVPTGFPLTTSSVKNALRSPRAWARVGA